MKNCSGISLSNWIAIGALFLAVLGFVHTQVSSTKKEINDNILKVDQKITDVSAKLDEHYRDHMLRKLCSPQSETLLGDMADAKESRTPEAFYETFAKGTR